MHVAKAFLKKQSKKIDLPMNTFLHQISILICGLLLPQWMKIKVQQSGTLIKLFLYQALPPPNAARQSAVQKVAQN
jgi:hypothetical protein